ncbi:hypothetical protein ABPG72_013156 [Tetrahymena utriculariae]
MLLIIKLKQEEKTLNQKYQYNTVLRLQQSLYQSTLGSQDRETEEIQLNKTFKICLNLCTCQYGVFNKKIELIYKYNLKGQQPIIGIDFGNTYSSVAINNEYTLFDSPYDIQNFTNNYYLLYNQRIIKQYTPSVVAFTEDEILVGESAWLQSINNPSRKGNPQKKYGKRKGQLETYQAKDISAILLIKMKEIAENYLGTKIKNAALTFPGYFSYEDRKSIIHAASIAGLDVKSTLSDYCEAIISYCLDKQGYQNILVLNLGGATMEASILNMEDSMVENISSQNDKNFGGNDFDQKVVDYFVKLIIQKYGKDISIDQKAIQKLKIEVEAAKKILSSILKTQIQIQNLVDGLDFNEELTSEKFEEINQDLFQKVWSQQDGYQEYHLGWWFYQYLKIQNSISDFFDKEPKMSIKPNEAVVIGLASHIDSNYSRQQYEPIICIDVTPLSLGIEGYDGVMSILIPRHSYLPRKKTKTFLFNIENQQKFSIKIFQGERLLVKDNYFISKLEISIPEQQKGQIEVEITSEIDCGGIIKVIAVEKSTNVASSFTFDGNPWMFGIQDFESNFLDLKYLSQCSKILIRFFRKLKDINYEATLFQNKYQISKEKINSKKSLKSYINLVKSTIDSEENIKIISGYDKRIIQETIKEIQNWLNNNPELDKQEYETKKAIYKIFLILRLGRLSKV